MFEVKNYKGYDYVVTKDTIYFYGRLYFIRNNQKSLENSIKSLISKMEHSDSYYESKEYCNEEVLKYVNNEFNCN